MKRIARIFALAFALAAPIAHAQFAPNTILTATALNSALAAPAITGGSINGNTSILTTGAVTLNGANTFGANTTAVTPSYVSNSGLIANDIFVRRTVLAASAAVPLTSTGGLYNTAPIGTGAIFGVTTSGGAVTSITGIVAGGTGYQVGDVVVLVSGNGDAFIWVTAVSSGAITTATVLYGGTGYSGTPQLAAMGVPPGSRTVILSGALTSNVTLIVARGTYLAGARRFGMANNTTGPYTVTVKLSNGSGGSTGTGVVVPQGSNNNTSMMLYTDGVSDIWNEAAGTRVLYNNAGVATGLAHGVLGTATTSGGTATVTLSNGAAYTSASSYICVASDTSATGGVQITQASGTSFTLGVAGGPAAHTVQYYCVGN